MSGIASVLVNKRIFTTTDSLLIPKINFIKFLARTGNEVAYDILYCYCHRFASKDLNELVRELGKRCNRDDL